jgi:DNA adenine methylase
MISPQQSLFPDLYPEMTAPGPVNVSTVPQRSPFRYPGGKTWFVPTFRNWVLNLYSKPTTLVEPFAGGGIISLTALFENMVQKAVMVELDEDVAAVWKTVVHGDAKWLANRILKFNLTRESVIDEISNSDVETKEKAFQTILKNRTNHGGILASGAGLLKHGENGKGIRSRWYPETLAKRFLDLDTIASRIRFCQTDGIDILQEYANQKDVIFFIDPPYTAGGKKAGSRLYRHCNLDHDRLFSVCEQLSGDFLMTYDNAEEVKLLARKHGFQMRLIAMNNTHHATMEELVIGKNLSWMDQYQAVHEPSEEYLATP